MAAEAGQPEVRVEVAGRANLIGDHTDYQAGLALPFALAGLTLRIEGRRVGDDVVITSELDGQTRLISAEAAGEGWGRYAAAVLRSLRDAGVAIRPLVGTIAATLPAAAGLSSSAALELAIALAVCDEELAPLELARICHRAESVYVGVPCGMLDQLAIVNGQAESALLLDCRDLSTSAVPWPSDLVAVVVHSGVSRSLGGSGYAQRRAEAGAAAMQLGVRTLRELGSADVPAAMAELPEPLGRRVRHVVSENERVRMAVAALRLDDRRALGRAMTDSHRSIADDLDASTAELDLLVELLGQMPGCVGARMTGGGFGGCALALVEAPTTTSELDQLLRVYAQRSGNVPRCWITGPADGIVAACLS
jgi:galactokinase